MTDGNDAAYACNETRGLTKRELFAAMAMQGMLSNSDYGNDPVSNSGVEDLGLASTSEYNYKEHWGQLVAQKAIRHADALIAELNKEQGV